MLASCSDKDVLGSQLADQIRSHREFRQGKSRLGNFLHTVAGAVDIAFVRRTLDPTGQGTNFRVLEARTGLTGLAAARLYHPQAIILDLLIPEMNGFEVLTALHNDPETRNIPVIVVSGAELSSQDRDRLSCNVAALRSKGALQPEELLHDLQRALG